MEKLSENKMRICFFLAEFPMISETFILRQITWLIENDHKVEIYSTGPPKNQPTHESIEKYNLLEKTVYRKPIPKNIFIRLFTSLLVFIDTLKLAPKMTINSLNFLKYGREAWSLKLLFDTNTIIKKTGRHFDVIHCHFGNHGLRAIALREVGALTGSVLTTFHGYDVNKLPLEKGPDVYKALFASGDLYTANTEFTKSQVVKLGCPEEKIEILTVGLDMDRYQYRIRTPGDNEKILILSVARLVEKKGIEYAIRALDHIRHTHQNVEYLVVGDGPLRGSLEKIVDELVLNDFVRFLGWKSQDEIKDLFYRSHIFVLPSVTASNGDREGQALVLQEAQATGMPIVSTYHNGIPDGVLEGRSGFLVPEQDVEALYEKLDYLLSNPKKWTEMGKCGRDFVENKYDIGRLNEKLVGIYLKTMSQ